MTNQPLPNIRLMTRPQAAHYITTQYGIPMSPLTLEKMASQGGGPQYTKFGRRAFCAASDIDIWVKTRMSRKFSSTSDEGSGHHE